MVDGVFMGTYHKIVFGDSSNMEELEGNSIQLVVTSPPYYNAPFDFPGLFHSYEEYLSLLVNVGKELYRVLEDGRVACFVVQDVRIKKKLYPIVADLIRIMTYQVGFNYRDKIIWKKPEGYIRISRRSGVQIQNPYPMYFYPDNIYEEVVIFQKGDFKYSRIPKDLKEKSRVNISRFLKEKWYLSIWNITNVLPNTIESKYTAAFPEELVERLILLYSYENETVLDPFLGTGTTSVVARRLNRDSVGYEIDLELRPIIEERLSRKILTNYIEKGDAIEFITREDAKHLRTKLRKEIEKKLARKMKR